MGGVEGEGFAAAGLAVAGFLNASDFVVDVIEYAASLVGALDQVAGFVVGVAEVKYGATKAV
nr:fosmidomycin resistance protein [Neisseria lactamica]